MKYLLITFISTLIIANIGSSFRIARMLDTAFKNKTSIESRIIGGAKTFINNHPYMAFLYRHGTYKNRTHSLWTEASCGSTVLSPRFVLTAAHCFRKCFCANLDDSVCRKCKLSDIREYIVYAGGSVPKYATTTATIKALHIHPQYKYNDMLHQCKNRYDIALLELASPLTFSAKVQQVDLIQPGQYFPTDYICEVVGWGVTNTVSPKRPHLLRELYVARMPIISTQQCTEYITSITGRRMCDGTFLCSESPTDTEAPCQGDSGGPIMCGGVQVGITSFGIKGCAGPKKPNVFTRVDISLKWINSIINGRVY